MKLDLKYSRIELDSKTLLKAKQAKSILENKEGPGSEMTSWTDYYDVTFTKEMYDDILTTARRLKEMVDILVVVGIGGSYLGSKAVLEAIDGSFNSNKKIVFIGNTFSAKYIADCLDYLKDKRFAVNVISKSGSTLETSIAFRALKKILIERHKNLYNRYIIATTDIEKGNLRKEANINNYYSFSLPASIGGRYSVITPVGLFPLAFAFDEGISDFINGVKQASKDLLEDNDLATTYAACRYLLGKKYKVEALVTYEPHLNSVGEWYKQLFGESEGKNKLGLLPIQLANSTDLHSLGQFVQDGTPLLFETVLKANPNKRIIIEMDDDNIDQLNIIAGKEIQEINDIALLGTLKAHAEVGDVCNIIIDIGEINLYSIGYLMYFMMKSCAISAYLLGVNPFNQEAVEIYKKKMKELLYD